MFKFKDILPLKPDTLWKIESGVVRSFTWDAEGRTFTLGFWGKGDVVEGHYPIHLSTLFLFSPSYLYSP
jgi:hypothetical protein